MSEETGKKTDEYNTTTKGIEMTNNQQPIILCAGQNGRALVYGYVAAEPVPGEPVRLFKARMIIYYPSGGTFGLASDGPPKDSRVTHAVEVVVETAWQEWLSVSPQAAEVFDVWE